MIILTPMLCLMTHLLSLWWAICCSIVRNKLEDIFFLGRRNTKPLLYAHSFYYFLSMMPFFLHTTWLHLESCSMYGKICAHHNSHMCAFLVSRNQLMIHFLTSNFLGSCNYLQPMRTKLSFDLEVTIYHSTHQKSGVIWLHFFSMLFSG